MSDGVRFAYARSPFQYPLFTDFVRPFYRLPTWVAIAVWALLLLLGWLGRKTFVAIVDRFLEEAPEDGGEQAS